MHARRDRHTRHALQHPDNYLRAWLHVVGAPSSVSDRPTQACGGPRYGLGDDPRIEYDHLIPLGLGGANDVRNLWPEPPTSPTQKDTANAKDDVETRLHDLVCAGKVTLPDAQARIATDWNIAAP